MGTVKQNIEMFACLGHRLSGTQKNHTVVRIIQELFNHYGLETSLEPVKVRGTLTYRFILNLVLLLLIYLLFKDFYLLSLLLFTIIFISLWGELSFSFHLLTPFIPLHPSANIVAKLNCNNKSRKKIIVVIEKRGTATIFY
jgi:hypothetical protein